MFWLLLSKVGEACNRYFRAERLSLDAPKRRKPPSQNWRSFLNNHIVDLCTSETVLIMPIPISRGYSTLDPIRDPKPWSSMIRIIKPPNEVAHNGRQFR